MLLDRFSEVKRLRDPIVAVGFDKHPIFSDIFTLADHGWAGSDMTKRGNGFVWDYFEQLAYRQELSLKFQKMVYSKNFSDRAHNRALQDAGRKVPPVRVIPESVEHLLLLSAADHMKAVGG